MKKILSIIIPTYNMEKYLHRCLDSLLVKEHFEALEVWVVNDGSKDRSSAIAHKYETKYPDVFHVLDKTNGNYGSCINAALLHCTGKYMRIVDADDWLDTSGLCSLLRNLLSLTKDVDAVFTNYQKINDSGKILNVYKVNPRLYRRYLMLDDEDLYLLRPNLDIAMHHIAYRTQLLKDIRYKQLEGISYTDTEYAYYPLINAKSFFFYDIVLYKYFIGREGQTISLKQRAEHLDDMLKISQRMIEGTEISDALTMQYLQRGFIVFTLSCFYHMALVCQKLTIENKVKLFDMDKVINKFDDKVYDRLNDVKCLGIPYIKFWRKYGVQVIPPILYRILFYICR